MANHCTDAVCPHCGASRCLIGCGDKQGASEELAAAVEIARDVWHIHMHYYSHAICHCCKRTGMYQYTTLLNDVLKHMNNKTVLL